VLQRGEDLPLLPEAAHQVIVDRHPGADHLERDPLAERIVRPLGEIDGTHPAVAQRAQDPVGPDPLAGRPGLVFEPLDERRGIDRGVLVEQPTGSLGRSEERLGFRPLERIRTGIREKGGASIGRKLEGLIEEGGELGPAVVAWHGHRVAPDDLKHGGRATEAQTGGAVCPPFRRTLTSSCPLCRASCASLMTLLKELQMPLPLSALARAAGVTLVLALTGCHEPAPTAPPEADVGPLPPSPVAGRHRLAVGGQPEDSAHSQIYEFVEGSPLRLQLTHFSERSAYNPVWSPAMPGGGSKIAFTVSSSQPFSDRLYVMNPDGSDQQSLLPAAPHGISGVVWAHGGGRLAFFDHPSNAHTVLSVVGPNGSGLVHLARDGIFIGPPAFSPDGSRIAFVHAPAGAPEALAVANADGSSLTDIVHGTTLNGPVWTDGGTHLEYTEATNDPGTAANERGLYRIDPDGSSPTRLRDLPSGQDYFDLSASPDGSRLTLFDWPEEWERVMAADGTDEALVNLQEPFIVGWYPQGDRVLMQVAMGTSNLYNVDARGTTVVGLPSAGLGNTGPAALSPDGAWIAFPSQFCRQVPPGQVSPCTDDISWMRSDGSSKTRLTHWMGNWGFSWAP
jgi:Tol biopolymer transport system component